MTRQKLLLVAAGVVVVMSVGLAPALFPPRVTYEPNPNYAAELAAYEAELAAHEASGEGRDLLGPSRTTPVSHEVTLDRVLVVGAGLLAALLLVGLAIEGHSRRRRSMTDDFDVDVDALHGPVARAAFVEAMTTTTASRAARRGRLFVP